MDKAVSLTVRAVAQTRVTDTQRCVRAAKLAIMVQRATSLVLIRIASSVHRPVAPASLVELESLELLAKRIVDIVCHLRTGMFTVRRQTVTV